MYTLPTGPLPVTGASLMAFALIGGALMIAGLVALRLAYFGRRRKALRAASPAPWRPR
jgi:hypothetical protein